MWLTLLVAQAEDTSATVSYLVAVATYTMFHGVAFVLEGVFKGFFWIAGCIWMPPVNVFDYFISFIVKIFKRKLKLFYLKII